MKKDSDEYFARDQMKKCGRGNAPQGKVNILLEELLEKEEETAVYKNRLKELETAFYYNLDLITERDLELTVLEKRLASENEQLQEVIREKDELEDLVKIINEKNSRKTQQLETKLALKEKEITELQRENVTNVNTLKRLMEDMKQQQQQKITKMVRKFEIHKDELIKGYRDEIEKKEKYYLLEIDNLTGKLEQLRKEKTKFEETEQENKNLRYHLQDAERLFLKKENHYLEEIKKLTVTRTNKINTEVQCDFKSQVFGKEIQAQPKVATAFAQTTQDFTDSVRDYIEKINFLQEQNEVLKYIVKDLKKNRNVESKPENPRQPQGCECLAFRTELENVNKKFENEMSNLRKILEEEQKQRTEEDAMIQSLETSVSCLKDKLLLGLQEKLNDFAGEDICVYTYNREIQNEIQITLLEQKLSKKIDSLVTAAQEERQKLYDKLEELKKEWMDKIEKDLKLRDAPIEFKSENLLEKIRLEIQKLENKIETDMKNIVRNNCEKNKCDKNFQTQTKISDTSHLLNPSSSRTGFPEVLPPIFPNNHHQIPELRNSTASRELYYKNDLSHEKYISIFKCARESNFQNKGRKTFGAQRGLRNATNLLTLGR